jgi:hypothetical protein
MKYFETKRNDPLRKVSTIEIKVTEINLRLSLELLEVGKRLISHRRYITDKKDFVIKFENRNGLMSSIT